MLIVISLSIILYHLLTCTRSTVHSENFQGEDDMCILGEKMLLQIAEISCGCLLSGLFKTWHIIKVASLLRFCLSFKVGSILRF